MKKLLQRIIKWFKRIFTRKQLPSPIFHETPTIPISTKCRLKLFYVGNTYRKVPAIDKTYRTHGNKDYSKGAENDNGI